MPWTGFFHKVAQCDVLVLQDDLQYVKQDVMNRTRVRSSGGARWLTIPVHVSPFAAIMEVTPVSGTWVARHRRILAYEYRDAPYRARLEPLWERLTSVATAPLSTVNATGIRWLLDSLGVRVEIVEESRLALPPVSNPNDRLIALARTLVCDTYLSGAGGHAYIDAARWDRAGVELRFQHFIAPRYARGGDPWIPNLSIVDPLVYLVDPAAALVWTSVQETGTDHLMNGGDDCGDVVVSHAGV